MAWNFVDKYEQVSAMSHGKFNCIKTINVRKKKVVQMRPFTAEILNNNKIPSNSVIRDKKIGVK